MNARFDCLSVSFVNVRRGGWEEPRSSAVVDVEV